MRLIVRCEKKNWFDKECDAAPAVKRPTDFSDFKFESTAIIESGENLKGITSHHFEGPEG